MAKIRTRCKAVSNGETRGSAERFGETMGEASVETSVKREQAIGYDTITGAKLRIHEDGSGLFELIRGEVSISIRWNPEETEAKTPRGLELFASFDGTEGMLVPAEETPR